MNSLLFLAILAASLTCACTSTQTGIIRHADGTKKIVYDYTLDRHSQVRHDSYREWHPNEQLKAQGRYEQGHRHGQWTEWYENGQKRYEGSFDLDTPVGQFEFWYPDGERMAELLYKGEYASPVELYLKVRAGGTLTEESFEREGPDGRFRGNTSEAIRKIREAAIPVQRCYEILLKEDPSAGGVVTVRWTIDLNGKSFGANLTRYSFSDRTFKSCIVDTFSNIQFARPTEGFITVSRTFVLSR